MKPIRQDPKRFLFYNFELSYLGGMNLLPTGSETPHFYRDSTHK